VPSRPGRRKSRAEGGGDCRQGQGCGRLRIPLSYDLGGDPPQ
jgi:hypothetical protein